MNARRGVWMIASVTLIACGGATVSDGSGGSGGSGALGGSGAVGGTGAGGSGASGGSVDPTLPGAQPPPDPNAPPSPSTESVVLAFNRVLLGDTDRQGKIDAQAWKQYG